MNKDFSSGSANSFSKRLVAWQKEHGRHDLPWQLNRDAYRIWVSEIMLQQTQVSTVIPRYLNFLERFPTVTALAAAPVDDVMAHWAGLGYYARARNMHRAAKMVVAELKGRMPTDAATLQTLPGIGRSTAAAIAVFSNGERAAILDGNVKRVLGRVFLVGPQSGASALERKLWDLAVRLVPNRNVEAYTQGLMDLGATICAPRKPACASCPVREMCAARQTDRISEFPPRPVKRIRPKKSCQMIIAFRRGKVLLERRPPKGIWGGLWCLPEAESCADVLVELQSRWGVGGRIEKQGEVLRHEFTHFSLDISPVLVNVGRPGKTRVGDTGWIWAGQRELEALGLPTPVSQLLRRHATVLS